MGNVLRLLAIVLISLVMGVAGLFLLVFTACGGLRTRKDVGFLAVCVAAILVGMIVTAFLALGLDGRRSTGVTTLGLAVPPLKRSEPRTQPASAVVLAASPPPPASGAPRKDS